MKGGMILAAVVSAAAIPVLSSTIRPVPGEHCAGDGVEVGKLLRIRIEAADGKRWVFGSVRCAEDWLAHAHPGAVRVLVTGEVTGIETDARNVTWAQSRVATSRPTGERLHAFRRREDARAHAEAFGGTLIEDDARPFRGVP